MPIRVIAGSAKGRRLKLVPGDSTRPIMDRAKESLFNIIGRDIYDTFFLDLFAGTGSVGIEALSRGAEHALFVDMDRAAIQTIQENLQIARLSDKATVQRMDALQLLKQQPRETYDFIYIAPPQFAGLWKDALLALEANPAWIPEGTAVIVQIAPRELEDVKLTYLQEYDRRKYGNTLLWFLESVDPNTDDEDVDASEENNER